MKGVAAIAVFAAFGVAAVPAVAQPSAPSPDAVARAKAADESARAHYDLREYAAAVIDYRRAFEAFPDPLFLFDIAQAYRQLHDCDNARAFYRNYLRERPTADNREKVEQFIAEMTACTTTHRDDRAVVRSPASRRHGLQLAAIVTGVAGLAISGVGVYFSFDAANHAHQLELACAQGCEGSAVASIDRAGRDANRDAIGAYAIGGTAVATGISLLVWSALDAGGEPPIIAPAPGGATVSATLRF